MSTETTTVRSAIVYRSHEYPHRYYDAFGDNVSKYTLNTIACPTDDTLGMPTEWVNTLVGASTFAHADVAGGAVVLTTAATTNDGIKLQLGDELGGAGENVDLSGPYPLYVGVKFAVNDADQTDVLFGVCVTDTTCLDGVTDGIYFRSIDEDATLYLVVEHDEDETVAAVATLTDAAYIEAEFLYDGSNVCAYINGTLMATISDDDANFPNDELMRLTVELLTGDDSANTCHIAYLRMIHIR